MKQSELPVNHNRSQSERPLSTFRGDAAPNPAETTHHPLASVRTNPTAPLVIDLDNTLAYRNPTDGFVDNMKPSSLAAVLVRAIDRLFPNATPQRRWARLFLLVTLMPWTILRWRKKAPEWVKENLNQDILRVATDHRGPVAITSDSYGFVVKPILKAIGCQHSTHRYLRRGPGDAKRSQGQIFLDSAYGSVLPTATVISNAGPINELLLRCHLPIAAQWPQATPTTPLDDAYVPLRYIQRTKNPRGQFVQAAWLTDDLYIAIIAFSTIATWFPLHAVGVTLASFALWISYETGYHENDVLGSTREVDPFLPDNFEQVKGTVPTFAPWIWVGALTMLAAPFLVFGMQRPLLEIPLFAGAWLAVVVAVRLTFAIFNRLPKVHRVIPHLLLQIGKYGGYAIVGTVSIVGLALVAAQTIYRWIPYVLYRWFPKAKFDTQPINRTRLAVFTVIALPGLILSPFSWAVSIQFVLGSLILARRAAATQRRVMREKKTAPEPMATNPQQTPLQEPQAA